MQLKSKNCNLLPLKRNLENTQASWNKGKITAVW
jgi:hypothetical protein